MAWTSHGHHIPETTLDENFPETIVRCGGVMLCGKCSREASLYLHAHQDEGIRVAKAPTGPDIQLKAKKLIANYYNERSEKTDGVVLTLDDIYVVWFAKTLQNWKALVSTTFPDGMYYELTYNGDKEETYIDAYKKFNNMTVSD